MKTDSQIEAMLGLNELKQTRVYQDAQQEEAVAIVLRLLKRRLGEIAPILQTQIQALPIAQAEELVEALLDFTCLEDLTTWLQTHSSQ